MASDGNWTFLTNHAHVLLCLEGNPDLRTRDLADLVGITERAVQRIVSDLESEGYLLKTKSGRRNHYEICRDVHLRHPVEAHRTIQCLLELIRAPDKT